MAAILSFKKYLGKVLISKASILKELTKILFNIWSPEAITLSIFFLLFRYSM